LQTTACELFYDTLVSYKTIYRRVQCFLRALDAPRLQLDRPVEIDEFYVKAGPKGHERDLSTRGRGICAEEKLPVFVLADRGSGERYVVPVKAATESKIRLLLAVGQQESLTVYTDGFRAYDPLEEDDAFTREYVVHGNGEYVDGDVYVNTCESHASLA
jgi:transposase